jgi:hypothetical protein
MVILGTHYVLLGIFKLMLKNYFDVTSPVYQFTVSVLIMIISVGIIYLSKKFVPALTGYRPLIKYSG